MSNSNHDEQDIERLLTAAGQRVNPPDEMRARVYAATLTAWEALPQSHSAQAPRPIANRAYLAMAASVLVAAFVGFLWTGSGSTPVAEDADVVFVKGSFSVDGRAATSRSVPVAATLQTDGESLLSLRMASGTMVTLDRNTNLLLRDADTMALRGGRLYVDADGALRKPVVEAGGSRIVDVGTQFEVVAGMQGEVTVAVREGRVDVSGAGYEVSAVAEAGVGEVVRVQDDAVKGRFKVSTTDARWDWRREGRKPYALAGSTVYDYLRWMARDTGHELTFASRAVEQMAKLETLAGAGSMYTSDDYELQEALAVTRFRLREPSQGRWMVEFSS